MGQTRSGLTQALVEKNESFRSGNTIGHEAVAQLKLFHPRLQKFVEFPVVPPNRGAGRVRKGSSQHIHLHSFVAPAKDRGCGEHRPPQECEFTTPVLLQILDWKFPNPPVDHQLCRLPVKADQVDMNILTGLGLETQDRWPVEKPEKGEGSDILHAFEVGGLGDSAEVVVLRDFKSPEV